MKKTKFLWLRDLPPKCRDNDVRNVMERYGSVQKIRMFKDHERRHAVVAFSDAKSAAQAIHNGIKLKDKTLQVEYCDSFENVGIKLQKDRKVGSIDNERSSELPSKHFSPDRLVVDISSMGRHFLTNCRPLVPGTKFLKVNKEPSIGGSGQMVQPTCNSAPGNAAASAHRVHPDAYRGLRLTKLPSPHRLTDAQLRQGLFTELRRCGRILSVMLPPVSSQGDAGRTAIVTFRRPEEAQCAYQAVRSGDKLLLFSSTAISAELHPGFYTVSCPGGLDESVAAPRTVVATAGATMPTVTSSRGISNSTARTPNGPSGQVSCKVTTTTSSSSSSLPQTTTSKFPTRTLYVGGLTAGPTGPVTSDQLITAFRKFGDIMDVQLLTGTNAALIQFTELRGPIRATNAHSRDPLRLGGRPLFLAYTSSPPTRYLWIAELPQSLSSLSDADLFQTMSELAPVQEIVLINRTESSPRGQSTTSTTTNNNNSSGDSFQSTSESPGSQQQQTSATNLYIAYVRLASADQAARLLAALRSRRQSEEDQQKQQLQQSNGNAGNNSTSATPARRPFAIDFASPRQTSLVASLQASAAKTPAGPSRIRVISAASLVDSVGSKRPPGGAGSLSRSLCSTETSTCTVVTTASSIASRSTATVRGSRPRLLVNSKTTASLPTTSASTGSTTSNVDPSIAAMKHRSKRKGQLLPVGLPTSRPAPLTPMTTKKGTNLNGSTAVAESQAAPAVGGTGYHRTRVNRDISVGSNRSCSSDTSLSSSSSVSSSSSSSSTSSTCSSTSGSSSSVSSASSCQSHPSKQSTSRSSLKQIGTAAAETKSLFVNNSEQQQQPSACGLKFLPTHSKQAQGRARPAGVHTPRSQSRKTSVDSHCSWSSSQHHPSSQPLQVVTTNNNNAGSSIVLSPTRSSVCSSGGLSSPGGSFSTAVTGLSTGPARTPNGTENAIFASSLDSAGSAAANNNNNCPHNTHLPVPATSFSSGMVTSSAGNSSSAVSPRLRSSTRTDPAGAATSHHRRRRSFSSTSSNCSRNSGSPLNSTSSALHPSTVNYYNTQTGHRHQQSAMPVSRRPVSAAWTSGHHHSRVDAVNLSSSSSGPSKPMQSDKKCFASKPSPVSPSPPHFSSPSRTPTTSSSSSHTTANPLAFSIKLVNTGLQSAVNPSSPSFSLAAEPPPGARCRHRRGSPVAAGSATPASSLSGSSQPRHTSATEHHGTTNLSVVNTTLDESCCSPQYSSRHSDCHSTGSPVYESMYDKIKRRTNKEAEERRQRQQEAMSARDKKRRKRQIKANEQTKLVSTKSPLPSACSTYTSPGYFGSEISEKTVGSSSSSHASKSKGQQTKSHSLVENQDLSEKNIRRESNDSDTRRADQNHKFHRLSQKLAKNNNHQRRNVRTLSSSSISTASVSLSDDNESNSSPGTLTRLSLGIGFPVSATYHECVRIGKHSRDERRFNWSSHSKTDGLLGHRSSSSDSTRTNKSKESLPRTSTSSRKSTNNALSKLSGSSTPVSTSLAGDDRDWLLNSTAATHSRTPETNNTSSSLAVKRKLSADDYHLAGTTDNTQSTPSYHWKRQEIKNEIKSGDAPLRVKREPPFSLKRAHGDSADRPVQCHLNDRKKQRLLRRSKVCERRQLREKEEEEKHDQPRLLKLKTCRYRSSNRKPYLSDDVLTLESEVEDMKFSNMVSQFPGLEDQHGTSKATFRHCSGHSSTRYDGQSMSSCTDDYSVMDTCSPSPTHLYLSSPSNVQKHGSRFSLFHRSPDAEGKANEMDSSVFNVFDSNQFSPKSTPSTEPMEQCDQIERNFGNDLSDDYDWQSSVGSTTPHTAIMDSSVNVECFPPPPEKSDLITLAAQKTPVVVSPLDQMPSVSSHKLPLSCLHESDQSTLSDIKTEPTNSECSFKQTSSPDTNVAPTSFHSLIASKAGSQTPALATILSPARNSLLSPSVPEPLPLTKSCLPHEVSTPKAVVMPSPTVPEAIFECVTTTSSGGISLCTSEQSISRTVGADKESITITPVSDDQSKACSSAVSRPVSINLSDKSCLILPTVHSQSATDTTTVPVSDNALPTIPSPTSSSLPTTSAPTTMVSKAMPSTKVTTEVRRQKPSDSPNITNCTAATTCASQIRWTLSTDCKTSSSSTLASTIVPNVHVPIAPACCGTSTGPQTEVRDDIHRYVQSVIERVKAERVEESQQAAAAAAAAAAAHYQSPTVVPAMMATSSTPINVGQTSTSASGRRLSSDETVTLPKVATSSAAGLLPSSTSCGKRNTTVSPAGTSQPRRPLLVTTNMCASASIPTRISPGSSDSTFVGGGSKFPAATANTTIGTTSMMTLSSPKFVASIATTASVVSSSVSDIRLPSIPGVNACAPLAVPPAPAIPTNLLQGAVNRVTRQQAMAATTTTTICSSAVSVSPTQQSTPSTDWHAPPKLANLVATVSPTPRRRRSGNKTTTVMNSSSSTTATTESNVPEAVVKTPGSAAPHQLSTAPLGIGRQQQTVVTHSPGDGGAILRQSIATRSTTGSANPKSMVVDPYEPNFDDDTPVLNFDPVQLHHHHHYASLGPTPPPPPVTTTSSQTVVSPSIVSGSVTKSSLAPAVTCSAGPVGGCCASPVSSISCRSPDSCNSSICVATTAVSAISGSDLVTATTGSSTVVAIGNGAVSPRLSGASVPLVTSDGHQQQYLEAAPAPVSAASALIPPAKGVDTVDEVIRDVCAGQFDVQSYLNILRSDAFAVPRGGGRPENSASTPTPTSGVVSATTATTTTTTISTSSALTSLPSSTAISSLLLGQPTGSTTLATTAMGVPVVTANTLTGKPFPLSLSSESVVAAVTIPVNQMTSLLPGYQPGEKAGPADTIRQVMPAPAPPISSSSSQLAVASTVTTTTAIPAPGVTTVNLGTGNALLNTLLAALQRIPGSQVTVTGPTAAAAGMLRGVVGQSTISAATITLPVCATPQAAANLKAALLSPSSTCVSSATITESKPSVLAVGSSQPTPISASDSALIMSTAAAPILSGAVCNSSSASNRDDLANAQAAASCLLQRQHSQVSVGGMGSLPVKRLIDSTIYTTPCQVSLPRTEVTNTSASSSMPLHKPPPMDHHPAMMSALKKSTAPDPSAFFPCDRASLHHHHSIKPACSPQPKPFRQAGNVLCEFPTNNNTPSSTVNNSLINLGALSQSVVSKPGQHLMLGGLHKQLGQSLAAAAAAAPAHVHLGGMASSATGAVGSLLPPASRAQTTSPRILCPPSATPQANRELLSSTSPSLLLGCSNPLSSAPPLGVATNSSNTLDNLLSRLSGVVQPAVLMAIAQAAVSGNGGPLLGAAGGGGENMKATSFRDNESVNQTLANIQRVVQLMEAKQQQQHQLSSLKSMTCGPPPGHQMRAAAPVSRVSSALSPDNIIRRRVDSGVGGGAVVMVAENESVAAAAGQQALSSSVSPGVRQQPSAANDSHLAWNNTLSVNYPLVWQGRLSLKNAEVRVDLHFVQGNAGLLNSCMTLLASGGGGHPQQSLVAAGGPLRIVQRMRLEPTQLEGVHRKINQEGASCSCLALPAGNTPIERLQQTQLLNDHFISYMQEKMAAGIINVGCPDYQQGLYVVHIFPPCEFSHAQLSQTVPDLHVRIVQTNQPHLLVVITTV